jgi:nucleoside-triphosphatase THEP1
MTWGDMHHAAISGEPGIGKSRIVQAVLDGLSGELQDARALLDRLA